jgi:hypothetical protein
VRVNCKAFKFEILLLYTVICKHHIEMNTLMPYSRRIKYGKLAAEIAKHVEEAQASNIFSDVDGDQMVTCNDFLLNKSAEMCVPHD